MAGISRGRLFALLLSACLVWLHGTPAEAVIYPNPITIDGVMTDWTSPGNIVANVPDQAAGDGNGDPPSSACPGSTDNDAYDDLNQATGTCVGLTGGVGRDLKTFAFTYDSSNLYLYVERFASSTNVTDWWFYIDADHDGLMESSDLVLRVKWQGSNQNTDREQWTYYPSAPIGDPLVGGVPNVADGYTMPGTINNRVTLTSYTGGAANGLSMETVIPWSSICGTGCGPTSVGFHVSSSNGSNLPMNIVDNMDGPGSGGSALVFLDLGIEKTVSASDVGRVKSGTGAPTITFTLTVTNNGGGDATDVEVEDILDAAFEFVSADDASYDPDSADNIWNIDSLAEGASTSLNIVVRPIGDGSANPYENVAEIVDLTEADTDASNDISQTVEVNILEPDLRIAKSHAGNFGEGYDGSYSIIVSNLAGSGLHTGEITVTDTLPSEFSYISYGGTGWICTVPVTDVECTYGNASTELNPGSSLPVLIITAHADSGGGTTVSNSATVVPASGMDEALGGGSGDNTVADSTNIVLVPVLTDIAVTKSVSNSTPVVGANFTFTVTATNNGPLDATGLKLTDVIPAGLSYVSDVASLGTYTSGTGVWDLAGTLTVAAGSATLTITVTADSGTGGQSITNNVTLSALTQIDSNAGNNAASVAVVPLESNLTTSTKTVVDVNGGQVSPGDQLEYTISLIETGGADATGVRVYDDEPANTGSLTIVSLPTVSTDASGVTYDLDITGITVPANTTETIVFRVTVDGSAPGFSVISNSATLVNAPQADQILSASNLTVQRGLVKQLYLHNVAVTADQFSPPDHPAFDGYLNSGRSLSRIPTTNTTAYLVSGGTTATWLLDPGLVRDLTIEDVSGGSIPAQLAMTRPSNGSKDATVKLFSDSNCDGSGGTELASSGATSILSSYPAVETFSLDLAADAVLATGDCLYLTVTNNNGSKDFSVLPYSAAATTYSQVDLAVFMYIQVDSVDVYDSSDTGRTTPLTTIEAGQVVDIVTVIGDPFGDFDITEATLQITDADLTVRLSPTSLLPGIVETPDDPATRTFEYASYTWPTTPIGNWKLVVEGTEGRELAPIQAQGNKTVTVIPPQPDLTVQKKIYDELEAGEITEVDSDQVVVYTITITNSGSGGAGDVIIEDVLSEYTALNIEWNPPTNTTPFEFVDGTTSSGYAGFSTWQYSTDNGFTFIDPGTTPLVSARNGAQAGFDGAVTDFRILMPALPTTMDSGGGSFTIKYKMHIR